MNKQNFKPNHTPRSQEGFIHVYVHGNQNTAIFIDDRDRLEFLRRCHSCAEKQKVAVLAYVLMEDHVHLQLYTKNITDYMRYLLQGYSQWFNSRHGLCDRLFKSPFDSVCGESVSWVMDSILYILSHPVRLKMCKHPSEYKWSSYSHYFSNNLSVEKNIQVNENFVRQNFADSDKLDKAILNFKKGINEIKESGQYTWSGPSEQFVRKHLKLILGGREAGDIKKNEIKQFVISLRNETGASYMQIASAIHTEYAYVRKVLKKSQEEFCLS